MRENDAFDRWGEAMAGGFQVVPNQLLRLQRSLGLSSQQVVILLNLSMHWWTKKDLPFIGPNVIAKRMGLSRRTIERQLKSLCEKGLVERKRLPESTGIPGSTVGYDLTGLVSQLEGTAKEPKSRGLAQRIARLRADRAVAAMRNRDEQIEL